MIVAATYDFIFITPPQPPLYFALPLRCFRYAIAADSRYAAPLFAAMLPRAALICHY